MHAVLTLARGVPAVWRLRLPAWLHAVRSAERGHVILWLPVLMGTGVLTYFAQRHEPPLWLGATLLLLATAATILVRTRPLPRAAFLSITAFALGLTASQVATWRAPPLLVLPTHAVTLTGIVRGVEPIPDGRRLLLEAVRLDDTAPQLPRLVRVRLRRTDGIAVATGDTVRLRALLRPPSSPAYPGAWDIQRDAFYAGLGGSGFALGAAELIAPGNPDGLARWMQRLRERVGARFTAAIPGAAGTIAATLFTGMSGAIPEPDHQAFRDSGLAHLLAVAGLHIGIVMGWTMFLTRAALALNQHAALHWPVKQLAALTALVVGGGYMVLTGMHLPIVRSFAMAALYTLAVLLGRRAISLRGLALAATALILLEPQEVPGVSFQMSFSAVLALIAGYEVLRPRLAALRGSGGWRGHFAQHLAMLALTSLLAGTASAPFGAYHFGRIQVYFIIANMIAVPLTAFWVMPLGLLALVLMPFGLEYAVLLPMGWGVQAVLAVAHTTASWPAAVLPVPHAPAWGLALVGLGIAWLGLWHSRIRLAGVVLLAAGLASPLLSHPADMLISDDARLIAARTPAGVFLEQGTGASRFTRDDWIDYWAAGDPQPIPQTGSVANGTITCDDTGCALHLREGGASAFLVRNSPITPDTCRQTAVLVAAAPARGLCPRPWPALVDRFTVWRYGATAIWLDGPHIRIVTDRAFRGVRPWVIPLPPPRTSRPGPALPLAPSD
jgi:competence protein ComEC